MSQFALQAASLSERKKDSESSFVYIYIFSSSSSFVLRSQTAAFLVIVKPQKCYASSSLGFKTVKGSVSQYYSAQHSCATIKL